LTPEESYVLDKICEKAKLLNTIQEVIVFGFNGYTFNIKKKSYKTCDCVYSLSHKLTYFHLKELSPELILDKIQLFIINEIHNK
jgi:hypothetical protein